MQTWASKPSFSVDCRKLKLLSEANLAIFLNFMFFQNFQNFRALRNLSRSIGLVAQMFLHQDSAKIVSPKATSWQFLLFGPAARRKFDTILHHSTLFGTTSRLFDTIRRKFDADSTQKLPPQGWAWGFGAVGWARLGAEVGRRLGRGLGASFLVVFFCCSVLFSSCFCWCSKHD